MEGEDLDGEDSEIKEEEEEAAGAEEAELDPLPEKEIILTVEGYEAEETGPSGEAKGEAKVALAEAKLPSSEAKGEAKVALAEAKLPSSEAKVAIASIDRAKVTSAEAKVASVKARMASVKDKPL